MFSPKQVGLVLAAPDMATGGEITLTVGNQAEQYRVITVAQATAGQAATLPAPSDISVLFSLVVSNTGSESLMMYGITISSGASAWFTWNGTAWSPDVAPTISGLVSEMLVATAMNTLPSLSVAPTAGSIQQVFINGLMVFAGVSIDAAGAVTIDPAVIGYNVDVIDSFVVVYSV